MLKEDNCGF